MPTEIIAEEQGEEVAPSPPAGLGINQARDQEADIHPWDAADADDRTFGNVDLGLDIGAILGEDTGAQSRSPSPIPAGLDAAAHSPTLHRGLGKRPSSSRDALTASTSTEPKARRGRPPKQRAVARPWADDPMWDGLSVRQGTAAPFEPPEIQDDVDPATSAAWRACRAAVFPEEVSEQSVIANADALHSQFASSAETTEKRHIWSCSVNLIKMCSVSWPFDLASRTAAASVELELRKQTARMMDKEEQQRRKQEKARRDAEGRASKRR